MFGTIPTTSARRARAEATNCPLSQAWWCNHSLRLPIRSSAACRLDRSWRLGRRLFSSNRLQQQVWLRYGMRLQADMVGAVSRRLHASTGEAETMSADLLAEFTARYPTANQVVTANSLWAHGLRRAFIARDATGVPIAFSWVLNSTDNPRLATLPHWGGMYPPIPPGWLQLENVFCVARSLARGRLITNLACAASLQVDSLPTGIMAHVGEHNAIVRRWIESLGCQRYGKIIRLHIDALWVRRYSAFIHTLDEDTGEECAPQSGLLQKWVQRHPDRAKNSVSA